MNLFSWLNRQRRWSNNAFGRTENVLLRLEGVREHIDSELAEIDRDPTDLKEWVDLAILSFEGALRAGHTPHDICKALDAKLQKNMSRSWERSPEGRASYHKKEAA